MKKQTVMFVLLISCSIAWSQEPAKTTAPCNNELLQKTPGRWLKVPNLLYAKLTKQQQDEVMTRLDLIHQWVFQLYPSPYGIDAYAPRRIADSDFAAQYKIDRSAEAGLRQIQIGGIPVLEYQYTAHFHPYSCGNTHEIIRGPGETGANLIVYANNFAAFLPNTPLEDWADVMQVEGRPIKMMPPLTGKWRGYDLYSPVAGSEPKMLLLHREGMLPFVPVTRKQYLDRCIAYIPRFFTRLTPDPKAMKALESLVGKQEAEEQARTQARSAQKQQEAALSRFQDELEATTKAGLLNAPAVLPLNMFNIFDTPIFSTEAAGGRMLVTENPAYVRKDLAKYIPQFFVLYLEPYPWWFPPQPDPYKMMEENFPIDKLQTMIDQ